MDERYKKFNEITFIQVAFTALKRNSKRAREKEQRRAEFEISIFALPDNMDFCMDEKQKPSQIEENVSFNVKKHTIEIRNRELGQAIQYLLPRDRAIILLYYFAGMKDWEIAEALAISKSTVQRRRTAAQEKLKYFLEKAK